MVAKTGEYPGYIPQVIFLNYQNFNASSLRLKLMSRWQNGLPFVIEEEMSLLIDKAVTVFTELSRGSTVAVPCRFSTDFRCWNIGINERENNNFADGLAWSYYFGYLKLVLPRLEGQITISEEFRWKINDRKLFILLPKTCYTYDNIQEADVRVKWAR